MECLPLARVQSTPYIRMYSSNCPELSMYSTHVPGKWGTHDTGTRCVRDKTLQEYSTVQARVSCTAVLSEFSRHLEFPG